jgi:putative IMPACT (imprinted ancient) family translation regulator
MKKFPPPAKIYEAYSAIADQRVHLDENHARVVSSNGSKEYRVTWKDDTYTSNDNATYWQGYAGYPVLAVLMLQGLLSLDREIVPYFGGIDWAQLNAAHKGDYGKAVVEVLGALHDRGIDVGAIEEAVAAVAQQIEELSVTIKRGNDRPPK